MSPSSKIATPQIRITDAVRDVFRHFYGPHLSTWSPWRGALHALYGYPILEKHKKLVRQCTGGRDPGLLPIQGFRTALFLTGRRSGKSRMAATIAAYEALFAGHEKRLAKGEKGLIICVSPTRKQSGVVKSYIRSIFDSEMLRDEIVADTKDGFELRNGLTITIMTGDWRSIRGFSVCAAIIDEICFMGLDEETYVKNDAELIKAIKPALTTTKGKLIAISSPHAKRGYAWEQFQKHFGNNSSNVLVWNCPSKTMNPTLSQTDIDAAYAEDYESARSEFGGEFRSDIGAFVSRELVESLVAPGRTFLMPKRKFRYHAFVDMSGGRSDAAALAIGHREGQIVIIDWLSHVKAEFVPEIVIEDFAAKLKEYNVHSVVGDNYGAEFTSNAFQRRGITYIPSECAKSELMLELLPLMTSNRIELPQNETLIKELSSLERHSGRSGRDIIDHPRNGHDDLANALAGVAYVLTKKQPEAGVMFLEDDFEPESRSDLAFLNALRRRQVSSTSFPWGHKASF